MLDRHAFATVLPAFLGALLSAVPASSTAQISGEVRYFGKAEPLAGVVVDVDGPETQSLVTDPGGTFNTQSLESGTYSVTPRYSEPPPGGVTALDAVTALMAAVGLRSLQPEEILACDADGSGAITAVDASLMLQYAVGHRSRLPVASQCGSELVFLPVGEESSAVRAVPPVFGPVCGTGSYTVDAAPGSSRWLPFRAIRLGDCSGDWTPNSALTPPTGVVTASPTASSAPSVRPSATASVPPATAVTTSPAPVFTPSHSPTQTAPGSATPAVTVTRTAGPANCTAGRESTLDAPLLLAIHPDERNGSGVLQAGRAHVLTTVPTSGGWGVFWLRDKTANTFDLTLPSTLYYAHVDLNGQISAGPMPLVDIRRHDREPLYLVAWRNDHFGLLVNELVNNDIFAKVTYQYYYDVGIDGSLSPRVGPIRTDLGYSGGIGDMVPYLDGFMVGIEVVCQGSHQCSFGYKLADHGASRGSDLRIVEFDGTHSFAPKFAYDGNGLVVTSWKDAAATGVVSQYITNPGTFISASKSIVPNKGSLNDNNPRVAWDGLRFGAVWREVQSLNAPGNTMWRMRMALFSRNSTASVLHRDLFLEPSYVVDSSIARSLNFTTDINPVGDGWVVSYARGRSGGEPEGTILYLDRDGTERVSWSAGNLDDYAFSVRAHFQQGFNRILGVGRTHRVASGVNVYFSRLNLDCPP